jgi:hypothetical protein
MRILWGGPYDRRQPQAKKYHPNFSSISNVISAEFQNQGLKMISHSGTDVAELFFLFWNPSTLHRVIDCQTYEGPHAIFSLVLNKMDLKKQYRIFPRVFCHFSFFCYYRKCKACNICVFTPLHP